MKFIKKVMVHLKKLRKMKSSFIIAFIISNVLLSPCKAQINGYQYHSQKNVTAVNGAVVCAHPLASMVGAAILKQGGNAIDAAIATQLALAVVYPGAGNIGGGGFMVAHLKDGSNITIDFREVAPAKASRDMYLDSNGNPLMKLSQDGHLASGVPGTIAGLFAAMKYARLPFKTLIEPAIQLAEKGFGITEHQAHDLNDLKKEFLQLNNAPVAFVKENTWKAGDTLVQMQLANTLKRIRDNGAKDFYEGETAKMITAEMEKGKGIINMQDLKNYTAKERKPMEFDYKDCHIITMPLPSSGGIILEQVLKMIDHKNIGAMKFQSAESVQLMVEAERRAFADRAEFLGDADFVKVPVSTLVSDKYLRERIKDFTPGKAGNSVTIKAGKLKESEETTHISILDKDGNAVSVTTTLNGSYGSRTVVGGAGFILNNQMDDFSVKPGVPNMYGAVGNEANAIAPGKRMLSSMSPAIVLKNKKPYLVVGTPGGTTIPTSVIQAIVNIVDFGMNAADAINKPKFHHQWLPDEIFVENDFNESTITALQSMGYKVTKRGAIGRTEIILITNKTITAVGDKRGDDDAEGY